jgi:hypothetical protein
MVELLILYLIATIVIGKFLHYLTTKPLTKGDYVVIFIVANGLAILITGLFWLSKIII